MTAECEGHTEKEAPGLHRPGQDEQALSSERKAVTATTWESDGKPSGCKDPISSYKPSPSPPQSSLHTVRVYVSACACVDRYPYT